MRRGLLLPLFFSTLLISSPAIAATHPSPSGALRVPYTTEIPNGHWVGPWKNACEEAVIAMVEQFYLQNHQTSIPRSQAIATLQSFFD